MTRIVDNTAPTPPPRNAGKPRVALAHDWLCGLRGGEHVLERIAGLIASEYDSAGLFVMFNDGRAIGPNVDAMDTTVSGVGRWPGADSLRRWLLPMYPTAVRQLSRALAREHQRQPIDLLISTSSAAIKGLAPPPGVPHLCYCHSPARYVWSMQEQYSSGLRGFGLQLMGPKFRQWDKDTSRNVTRFIANSDHTAREISRCYGRGAEVVYPPVREMFFENPPASTGESAPWLVVSALEPYKRVELAIATANKAGHDLVVVGDGSQRPRLEAGAGPCIKFLGRVPDAQLREWYRRASLLLFPQVEDFGIVAVEAQACGLPVVARAMGGATEIVIDGVTGALFSEDSVDSLLAAVRRCPRDPAACRHNAERFTESRFDDQMRTQIAAALTQPGVAPSSPSSPAR